MRWGRSMAAREYLNFDLELGSRGEGYVARVNASPVGETSGAFSLPFTPEGLENVVLRLGRSRTTVRRVASSQDELVRGFGTGLYDAVFAGEVGTSLRRSIDEAARQGKGLRIRLHLEDAPELGEVPWELLYVPGLSRHLVLSSSTPLVRYLGLPGTPRPLRVDGPIRVLLVVAAPTDVVSLDAAHEVALIEEATADLRQAGVIAVDSLPGASLPELQRRLRRADYHVLHFIGHGGFDERAGEGVLDFETGDGHSHLVPTSRLGTILADHSTLRLAVLNACEGARTSTVDPFAGIAPGLIRQGIPAVIAMQFEVTDTAAAIFGHEFYLALADGCPVDQAAAEARKAMYASDCVVEWATPVLYLRASDGRIFDTPSIDRSGLERPASLGAAPVDTGDLDKPAGRPAPTPGRASAAPAAPPREPPPAAPTPATAPAAAVGPSVRERRAPRPDEDHEEADSPYALPFPIGGDGRAAEPRQRHARARDRGGAREAHPPPPATRGPTAKARTVEEDRDSGDVWEGWATGGSWPPARQGDHRTGEYLPASTSGRGHKLLVLLVLGALAVVGWSFRDQISSLIDDLVDTIDATETETQVTDDENSGTREPPNRELEGLVQECRDGSVVACEELLQQAEAGSAQHAIAVEQLVSRCQEPNTDACDVLLTSETDSDAWEAAFDALLDCSSGAFDRCGEVAREHGDDRLTEAVDEWLAVCQGWDRVACQRVLGFAESESPPWQEASEVLSSIPQD
jgi:hypothetical protein